jgi:hypothetical protein
VNVDVQANYSVDVFLCHVRETHVLGKAVNNSPCFSSKRDTYIDICLMGLWHKQLLDGRRRPRADGYKGITVRWNYTLASLLNFGS